MSRNSLNLLGFIFSWGSPHLPWSVSSVTNSPICYSLPISPTGPQSLTDGETTLQFGDSLQASRCHLLLPKVPWHKGQSNACASATNRHHPRQRNTTVSSGREQEWLQAAECLALSRSRVQPSHPLLPSQLPTFSPFNTHSFSTRPLSDEKFPARGHGSNGLLKRNAIPYSRQTSSFFSPWGGRIIVQPGRKKKKKKTSPKPVVIILNKRPKGFGQENPKFKRIITPRVLSLKLSH